MSDIKRYDIHLVGFCDDCYAEMRPADRGDYVLHADCEAREARALRMEQTIARVREVLREMDANPSCACAVYDDVTDALRNALEGT